MLKNGLVSTTVEFNWEKEGKINERRKFENDSGKIKRKKEINEKKINDKDKR